MSDNGINKFEKLSLLIQGMLTVNLTEDEFQILDQMISDDSECLKYYIEYTTLWALLDETECLADNTDLTDYNTMTEPALKERETTHREKSPFVARYKQEKQSILFSKWKVVSILLSAAAMLFIVLVIKLSTQKPYEVEIATIVDQINTRWNPETPLEIGSRLEANEMQLSLEQGVVKIQFNDNVDVLIEGPAVFKIEKSGLFLEYGSLYCRVSKSALGFTVETLSAKYVDLGTVFGIKSDGKGVSELHVFKGMVRAVADSEIDSKVSRIIKENNAIRYDADKNLVGLIPIEQKGFVSHFDSGSEVILRGQNYIDLADIVGGGNGLGTGTEQAGINPVSGRQAGLISGTHISTNSYRPVPSNPYVDGIFVPNGRKKQIISSHGNVFEECPVTSGSCFNNIGYAMRSVNANRTPETGILFHSITMHANTGITFDLNAIRRLMPEAGTIHFRSQFGIERMPSRPKASNADFWILVDGKLKFSKTKVKHRNFHSVDIELSQSDRFLTLVVTDGSDPENRIVDGVTVNAIDSDWGMFAEPVLVAE